MLDRIKEHLKTPGNSIRVGSDNVGSWRLKMAKVCHKLLVIDGWGMQSFNQPAFKLKKCKVIKFDLNSRE